jgi:hypothetical protein
MFPEMDYGEGKYLSDNYGVLELRESAGKSWWVADEESSMGKVIEIRKDMEVPRVLFAVEIN